MKKFFYLFLIVPLTWHLQTARAMQSEEDCSTLVAKRPDSQATTSDNFEQLIPSTSSSLHPLRSSTNSSDENPLSQLGSQLVALNNLLQQYQTKKTHLVFDRPQISPEIALILEMLVPALHAITQALAQPEKTALEASATNKLIVETIQNLTSLYSQQAKSLKTITEQGTITHDLVTRMGKETTDRLDTLTQEINTAGSTLKQKITETTESIKVEMKDNTALIEERINALQEQTKTLQEQTQELDQKIATSVEQNRATLSTIQEKLDSLQTDVTTIKSRHTTQLQEALKSIALAAGSAGIAYSDFPLCNILDGPLYLYAGYLLYKTLQTYYGDEQNIFFYVPHLQLPFF
jgi:polyhydroxyalkanoate synthesis regulator phasin